MLRLSALTSAAFLVLASSSFAADLPTRKGPPPAPVVVAPAFNWTGFYIGGNLGGAWGSTSIDDHLALAPVLGIPPSQAIGAASVLGGVQAGYNYQVGNFVVGGELEFDAMALDGSKTIPIFFGLGTDSRKADADWLATAGLRLGYAVDRLLFYAKGGAALTDYSYRDVTTFPGFGGVWNSASNDAERWGWMIGGGVEWAFAANWTAKAEYDYIGFDRQNITLNGAGPILPANIPLGISNSISLAKIGVNYKF